MHSAIPSSARYLRDPVMSLQSESCSAASRLSFGKVPTQTAGFFASDSPGRQPGRQRTCLKPATRSMVILNVVEERHSRFTDTIPPVSSTMQIVGPSKLNTSHPARYFTAASPSMLVADPHRTNLYYPERGAATGSPGETPITPSVLARSKGLPPSKADAVALARTRRCFWRLPRSPFPLATPDLGDARGAAAAAPHNQEGKETR